MKRETGNVKAYDVETPALLLHLDVVERNLAHMAARAHQYARSSWPPASDSAARLFMYIATMVSSPITRKRSTPSQVTKPRSM